MSDSALGMRRKIKSARDLKSVVRTMKAMASASIGQYEKSVAALGGYYDAIALGLGVCLREAGTESVPEPPINKKSDRVTGVIVFGSDQGMVGRFNDVIADYTIAKLKSLPDKHIVWAVGERVYYVLRDEGISPVGRYAVPYAISDVTPLLDQLLIDCEASLSRSEVYEIRLFHNRPHFKTVYEPVNRYLLPFSKNWRRGMSGIPWPSNQLPDILGDPVNTLQALIHESLFVSLFQACAESLASEKASRLAAMQRADKNIDELLDDLQHKYHQMRQMGIDAELFDVIAGAEAMRQTDGR